MLCREGQVSRPTLPALNPKPSRNRQMAKKTTKKTVQKKAAAEKRKAAVKADAPKTQAKFNSPVNEEDRALFLQHLPKIAELKAKLATANANLRNAYKTAKADGFLKGDFEVAFQIQGAEGEKAKKAAIARDLTIAKWLGCDLGAQLDLFVQDERVPAADRAYEEGRTDSMSGKTAKPDYDPSTEQHRRYMEGYHSVTEERINKGISKKTEETPGLITEAQKEAAKGKETPAKKNGKPIEEPSSGVPMTRAQFNAMKAGNATGQEDIEEVTVTEPVFKRKGEATAG